MGGARFLSSDQVLTRIRSKIRRVDECWIWTGAHDNQGYGSIRRHGVFKGVHRVFYELVKGPVPDGLHIDHLCRVRDCVNPDHMDVVTGRENQIRGDRNQYFRATHCIRGHEFTLENTYHPPKRPNQRHCRICQKMRQQTIEREG